MRFVVQELMDTIVCGDMCFFSLEVYRVYGYSCIEHSGLKFSAV